jgi:hypothetical protein
VEDCFQFTMRIKNPYMDKPNAQPCVEGAPTRVPSDAGQSCMQAS